MKRLIVFIFILLLLVGLRLDFTKNMFLSQTFSNQDAQVYLTGAEFKDESGCGNYAEILEKYNYIKNGEGLIVFCKGVDLGYILTNFNALGFAFKLKNIDEVALLNLLKPAHLFNSSFGFYGFSSCMPYSRLVDGVPINFQIYKTDAGINFGCPLLLGSF